MASVILISYITATALYCIAQNSAGLVNQSFESFGEESFGKFTAQVFTLENLWVKY